MATIIGSLEAVLGMDARSFVQGAKQAGQATDQLAAKTKTVTSATTQMQTAAQRAVPTLRATQSLFSATGLGASNMGVALNTAASAMETFNQGAKGIAATVGIALPAVAGLAIVIQKLAAAEKAAREEREKTIKSMRELGQAAKFASEEQTKAVQAATREQIAALKARREEIEKELPLANILAADIGSGGPDPEAVKRLEDLRNELAGIDNQVALFQGVLRAAAPAMHDFAKEAEEQAAAINRTSGEIREAIRHQRDLIAAAGQSKDTIEDLNREHRQRIELLRIDQQIADATNDVVRAALQQQRALIASYHEEEDALAAVTRAIRDRNRAMGEIPQAAVTPIGMPGAGAGGARVLVRGAKAVDAEGQRARELRNQALMEDAAALKAHEEAMRAADAAVRDFANAAAFVIGIFQAARGNADPLGGAASGAFTGSTFGFAGAAIGALAGLAGGIAGLADEADEAARRVREAQKEFGKSLDAMVEDAGLRRGTDFERGLVQARRANEGRFAAFHAAFPEAKFSSLPAFPGNDALGRAEGQLSYMEDLRDLLDGKAAEELDRIIQILAEDIEFLKEQFAEAQAAFKDEIAIRTLMAQGHKEAAQAIRDAAEAEELLKRARELGVDEALVKAMLAEEKLARAREEEAEAARKAAEEAQRLAAEEDRLMRGRLNAQNDLNVLLATAFGTDADVRRAQAEAQRAQRNQGILAQVKEGFLSDDQAKQALAAIDKLFADAVAAISSPAARDAAGAARTSRAAEEVIASVQGITATQATTLIDIGRSQLVQLSAIEFNTRRRGEDGAFLPGHTSPFGRPQGGSGVSIQVTFNNSLVADSPRTVGRLIAQAINEEMGSDIETRGLLSGNTQVR